MRDYKDYDGWREEDIALHKATDWEARHYEELPTEDTINAFIVIHRWGQKSEVREAKMRKFIRPNPIYPPYYRMEEPVDGVVGPMFDGIRAEDGYDIHDRYEDQRTYDLLSM